MKGIARGEGGLQEVPGPCQDGQVHAREDMVEGKGWDGRGKEFARREGGLLLMMAKPWEN